MQRPRTVDLSRPVGGRDVAPPVCDSGRSRPVTAFETETAEPVQGKAMADPETSQLNHLESELRLHRRLLAGTVVLALFLGLGAWGHPPGSANREGDVLRGRGLVLEDADGRPRVLLGAPVPQVDAWVRPDTSKGLVILDASGTARTKLGYPANPVIRTPDGSQARTSPCAGLTVHDTLERERGGMGALDNGDVVVGLDYPTREGVALSLSQDEGYSGLVVWGRRRGGGNPQRLFLGASVTPERVDPGILVLNDTTGRRFLSAHLQDSLPTLELYRRGGSLLFDAVDRLRGR